MFGGGALFGLLAGAVLYAPPELGNQPPPWQHWASDQGGAAAATPTAGASPTQPVVAASAQPAAAAPEPVAAASSPASVAQAPVSEPAAAGLLSVALAPAPQAAASAPAPVKVAKKRKVQVEEAPSDTSVLGSGPAPEPPRVEPEGFRAPAESAPLRIDGEGADPSR